MDTRNPMLEMLRQNSANAQIQNGTTNPIAQVYKTIKAATNPVAALMQRFSQSQIGQVMNYVKQNGGNAQQAFYNLAKEKGVDPNDILNQLRG